jgi:tRNA A37 methylthiotransferase MiaB
VDNEVLIPDNPKYSSGEFYRVRITGAEEFDLYGEVV